jgi:hypothetical protein
MFKKRRLRDGSRDEGRIAVDTMMMMITTIAIVAAMATELDVSNATRNMINCLKVDQQQRWVDHLFERNRITTTKQYNAKRRQKIERKLPRQNENLTKIDLKNTIATMITKPNKSWNNLRSRNFLVPRSYFH